MKVVHLNNSVDDNASDDGDESVGDSCDSSHYDNGGDVEPDVSTAMWPKSISATQDTKDIDGTHVQYGLL